MDELSKAPNFKKIEIEEELQEVEKFLDIDQKAIVKNASKIRSERIAGKRYLLYKEIVAEFKRGLSAPIIMKGPLNFY